MNIKISFSLLAIPKGQVLNYCEFPSIPSRDWVSIQYSWAPSPVSKATSSSPYDVPALLSTDWTSPRTILGFCSLPWPPRKFCLWPVPEESAVTWKPGLTYVLCWIPFSKSCLIISLSASSEMLFREPETKYIFCPVKKGARFIKHYLPFLDQCSSWFFYSCFMSTSLDFIIQLFMGIWSSGPISFSCLPYPFWVTSFQSCMIIYLLQINRYHLLLLINCFYYFFYIFSNLNLSWLASFDHLENFPMLQCWVLVHP